MKDLRQGHSMKSTALLSTQLSCMRMLASTLSTSYPRILSSTYHHLQSDSPNPVYPPFTDFSPFLRAASSPRSYDSSSPCFYSTESSCPIPAPRYARMRKEKAPPSSHSEQQTTMRMTKCEVKCTNWGWPMREEAHFVC